MNATEPSQDGDVVSPAVLAQIEEINLAPDRPLLISDGDEVIFAFVAGLEEFMAPSGLYFAADSFALTGNIRFRESGEALPGEEVRQLILDFHAERMASVPLVAGAAASLGALGQRCQIVVLSNIALDLRGERARALANNGLDLPVVANAGLKGPAVRALCARAGAPVFFLDDIPRNLQSVRAVMADAVHCIHFVGDPRLARLLPASSHAHARFDDWPSAQAHIEALLSAHGF